MCGRRVAWWCSKTVGWWGCLCGPDHLRAGAPHSRLSIVEMAVTAAFLRCSSIDPAKLCLFAQQAGARKPKRHQAVSDCAMIQPFWHTVCCQASIALPCLSTRTSCADCFFQAMLMIARPPGSMNPNMHPGCTDELTYLCCRQPQAWWF